MNIEPVPNPPDNIRQEIYDNELSHIDVYYDAWFKCEGYDVGLMATYERGSFNTGYMTRAEAVAFRNKVFAGELVIFEAHVVVLQWGYVLYEGGLGKCHYKSYEEFTQIKGGYFEQIVREGIDAANQKFADMGLHKYANTAQVPT